MKRNERPKYIQKIYTNEDKTLFQSIIYSIVLDEESNGLESKVQKARIKPNLMILVKRNYLDENFTIIDNLEVKE